MRIVRLAGMLAAAAFLAVAPAHAQSGAPAPATAPPAATAPSPAAALDTIKAALDDIDKALRDSAESQESLRALRARLSTVQGNLDDSVGAVKTDLAQTTERLKQIANAPAGTDQDAALAGERSAMAARKDELDRAVTQARSLSDRADDLASRITERRRAQFARELFTPSAGLFDLSFWKDVGSGIKGESDALLRLGRYWWTFARDNGGLGWIGALVTLAAIAVAALMLMRWWRRILARPAVTRFQRALAAILVLIGHAAAMPAIVIAVVLVLELYDPLPGGLSGIGFGLATAVAIASFGRAAAMAFFAPAQPERRISASGDVEAVLTARHMTLGARALGLAVLLNVLHRATGAPLALTMATSTLLALVVAGCALHFLWRTARQGDPDAPPSRPGLRILLWAFVVAIIATLAAGYIALAAFLSGRLVVLLSLATAIVVADAFVDAFLTDVVAGAGPRARALSSLLGLSPRGLDLVATLLSAVIRLVLLLLAAVAAIGPWQLFADDIVGALTKAALGWHIAGVTISIGTVLFAVLLLLLGILAVRAGQRWLDINFLPRTGLEPSLQHSISALFGYAGFILVLALVLGEIGIDLQKIALVAGALSVGIGFGLQSVVSNFVSGLILLAERPIRVGDWVVVKNEEGFVRRISVRATEIETFDRASVIIPNSEFITGVVKNWTHANTMGRVTIKVRASYDSDVERVREILLGCARQHPMVLQTPPPGVYLLGFSDIGLDFELRCILANVENALTVRSDLHRAVLAGFRAGSIKIPYPPHEARVPGAGMFEPHPADPAAEKASG